MLVLAVTGIGKTAPTGNSARIDWAGSAWLSVALLCFALAASGGRVGVNIAPWMLLLLAIAALLVFIRTELAAPHPLIPVALARGRGIATSLSMNLVVATIMMSTLVAVSYTHRCV